MEDLDVKIYPIDHHWIKKLMAWAEGNYPYLAYFSPNSISYPYGGFDQVLFAGEESFSLIELEDLPDHLEKVGILSYDLKNSYESLQSNNKALVDCPDAIFFIPSLKIKFHNNQATISHPQAQKILETVNAFQLSPEIPSELRLSGCTSKEAYIQNVQRIKEHIVEGDIYEMNYCIAFQAECAAIDPVQTYFKLCQISPMPFSTLFKAGEKYVIGASPERFLKRAGSKIIAQPIKGTVKRGETPAEDRKLRQILESSEKERAENLMIVDLMRNDLSKISITGKVRVEELFGIYSFKPVSQMISTVSSSLKEGVRFEEIIADTFPMGSMTGAPKIKCMELIDRYENFRRGWFSGSIGYISAKKEFDFNVVIRSIILDKETDKLFFAVGSAITYDADPEQEYEECLLKAQPIFETLGTIPSDI